MRCFGVILLAMGMTAVAFAQQSQLGSSGRAPVVEITESSAVVYAIPCPAASAPVWQEVDVKQLIVVPGTGLWRGVGNAEVCGVEVSGSEREIILACERADGVHHGAVASYYPDGLVRTSGYCREGKAHGEWNRWRQSGRPVVKGKFSNGRKTGKWLFWGEAVRPREVAAGRLVDMASPF